MKKEAVILALILACTLVLAVPTLTLQQESYQPGETIIGQIQGNFAQPLTSSNFKFFDDHKQISPEFGLIFYNDTYYFYLIPTKPENLTMDVDNVLYRDSTLDSINLQKKLEIKPDLVTTQEQQNISGNITTVTRTATQILSVSPGVIYSDKPQLTLLNKGSDALNVTFTNQTYTLVPGDSQTLSFTTTDTFSFQNISSYKTFSIPVIIFSLHSSSENITNLSEISEDLKVSPSPFIAKIIATNQSQESLDILNFAEENLTNVVFYSNISFLKIPEIDLISAKSSYTVNFTLYSEEQGVLQDSVVVTYLKNNVTEQTTIPVEIFVFPSSSPTNESIAPSDNTCTSLQGTLCQPNENCEGNATYASDGYPCCFGSCVQSADYTSSGYNPNSTSSSSSTGWIIGIIIILVLAVGGFFVYKKIKKTKPKAPDQKMQEKSKLYEKRISGGLERA